MVNYYLPRSYQDKPVCFSCIQRDLPKSDIHSVGLEENGSDFLFYNNWFIIYHWWLIIIWHDLVSGIQRNLIKFDIHLVRLEENCCGFFLIIR